MEGNIFINRNTNETLKAYLPEVNITLEEETNRLDNSIIISNISAKKRRKEPNKISKDSYLQILANFNQFNTTWDSTEWTTEKVFEKTMAKNFITL